MVSKAVLLAFVLLYALVFADASESAPTSKPQHGMALSLSVIVASANADCLRIHLQTDGPVQIHEVTLLNAQLAITEPVDCSSLWPVAEEGITLYRTLQHDSVTTPIQVTVTWQQQAGRFSQTQYWPDAPPADLEPRAQTVIPKQGRDGLHILQISPAQ